jgi:hypothetical protein
MGVRVGNLGNDPPTHFRSQHRGHPKHQEYVHSGGGACNGMVLYFGHQGRVHSDGRVIKGPIVVDGVEVDERMLSHGQPSHQSSPSHSFGLSLGKGFMV